MFLAGEGGMWLLSSWSRSTEGLTTEPTRVPPDQTQRAAAVPVQTAADPVRTAADPVRTAADPIKTAAAASE